MENSNYINENAISSPEPDMTDVAYGCEVGGGKRFFGYLIDMVAFYIIGVAILFVIAVQIGGFDSETSANVVSCIILFVYYVFFETLFQRTPGKMLLGMKVVTPNGDKPTVSAILIRSISRFVPFDGLSYFWTDGCWHNVWSETVVVSSSELRNAMEQRRQA